ncbi:MAG TPA: PrsW family glutamic-type intramembrane protease [Polyangiaceae bacterium]
MLATLRWLLPAALPAALFAVLAWRTDPRREPRWLSATTFFLGSALALVALLVTNRVAALAGSDADAAATGAGGELLLLFFVVAPTQEAAKVAAVWPALLSKRVGERYDGVVYAAAASLGFAAVENALTLRAHPAGGIWVARALVALPAHVFFACLWGYALGRARHARFRVPIFPSAFLLSIAAHGLYVYFVYGRGPWALLGVSPLLAAMGVVTWVLARDLRERHERALGGGPPSSRRWARLSAATQPPSLASVRAALVRADEPMRLRWVAFGALVVLGAMWSGLAAGVVGAHLLHVDLSRVDDQDARSAAPAILLVVGLLGSFPVSGWLVARAAGAHTLLEPALAAALAIIVTLTGLGLAAPFTVAFGLALSPIAWVLACAGAWVGLDQSGPPHPIP